MAYNSAYLFDTFSSNIYVCMYVGMYMYVCMCMCVYVQYILCNMYNFILYIIIVSVRMYVNILHIYIHIVYHIIACVTMDTSFHYHQKTFYIKGYRAVL